MSNARGAALRVLVIADAKIPVPPVGYGGAERIIALLCDGLKARGCTVKLMGARGSKPYDGLIAYPFAGEASRAKIQRVYARAVFTVMGLFQAARSADVIIAHSRTDYLTPLLWLGKPMIIHFHNPIDPAQVRKILQASRGPLRLISVSDSQRRGHDPSGWSTIFNAVDTERPVDRGEREGAGYLGFLGRITRNKGVHTAIAIAKEMRLPLKIAGNIGDGPEDQAYFDTEVKPHLGEDIEWLGEVDDDAKMRFLCAARALLVPVLWAEPFGIVVAEAASCGTPVIAHKRGAMPELIAHGVNGFLVENSEEMREAILRVSEISRAECRRVAVERFSGKRFIDQYCEIIRGLTGA